jgi:hypothetical protein
MRIVGRLPGEHHAVTVLADDDHDFLVLDLIQARCGELRLNPGLALFGLGLAAVIAAGELEALCAGRARAHGQDGDQREA